MIIILDDGYDGVQCDTFYDPAPGMTEAEEIRRECAAETAPRRDAVPVTRPY
jgi:hypothetical protein